MSSSHYTTLPDGKVPLKVTCDGPASRQPRTVMDVFKSCVERHPQRPALLVKRDKKWKVWTYEQYYADVKSAAKSFIRLGLKPYHSVGILGFNSPEWFIADLGAIFAGGFAAGIYATNGPDACRFVADHARANIIVVENDKQLEKILQIRAKLPHLLAIVQYDGKVKEELKAQNVYEWSDFMRLGADMPDYELQWRITPQEPGNCCTLIYTSGTTGEPKAVMISHDNITYTAGTCAELLNFNADDSMISYLPLSHVAAQMIDIHAPLVSASAVWFAQPDALKGSLVNTLKEVRPTIFLGVPRVWEKVMEKMQAIGRETTGFKASIAKWAKEIGLEGGYNIQRHQDTPFGWWLADTLVFSKVKEGLGLDRCRIMATSAAPISKECLEYFLSLNIPIYEIYGMSECTGPETLSFPGTHILGSCGKPIPGAELKIFEPDQEGNGETCFRGRHVFMGYLFNEAKTKEAIDDKGWLHSGDIGRQDKEGFLYITGRIKELIITAGGENVAPVPIEDAIKLNVPIMSNCMLIGDRKKFLSLLVTLKTKPDAEGNPSSEFSQEAKDILKTIGSAATTIEEAQTCPKLQEYITKGITSYNKNAVSNAQKVQKFKILPRDFSIAGEELTPTMKLRRPIVSKMYDTVIESMYADAGGEA